jgi:excisionase family DNA binding protein
MNLEEVISTAVSSAVASALAKQLPPLLERRTGKLKPEDIEYLTTHEAAGLLRVSPITLRIWRHQKRGPEYMILGGRGVRYKRSVLLEFLERNGSLVGKRGRPPKTEIVKTNGRTTRDRKEAKSSQAGN